MKKAGVITSATETVEAEKIKESAMKKDIMIFAVIIGVAFTASAAEKPWACLFKKLLMMKTTMFA
jgi:hypothetical protein